MCPVNSSKVCKSSPSWNPEYLYSVPEDRHESKCIAATKKLHAGSDITCLRVLICMLMAWGASHCTYSMHKKGCAPYVDLFSFQYDMVHQPEVSLWWMDDSKFAVSQWDLVHRAPESCTSALLMSSSLWSMWVAPAMQKGCASMNKGVLTPSWHRLFAQDLSRGTRKRICTVQLSVSFQYLLCRTGFYIGGHRTRFIRLQLLFGLMIHAYVIRFERFHTDNNESDLATEWETSFIDLTRTVQLQDGPM